jgi:hypothetical protein
MKELLLKEPFETKERHNWGYELEVDRIVFDFDSKINKHYMDIRNDENVVIINCVKWICTVLRHYNNKRNIEKYIIDNFNASIDQSNIVDKFIPYEPTSGGPRCFEKEYAQSRFVFNSEEDATKCMEWVESLIIVSKLEN